MRNLNLLYRKAIATDCPRLVEIHYAAVQVLSGNHYSAEVLAAWSPIPDERRRQWLAGVIAQDGTFCTVALAPDGELVGFFIALPQESLLRAIYVHPAYAGAGIGRGLMQEAEKQCRARGVTCLGLNASLNAEAFYVSCGYAAIGPVAYPLTPDLSMAAIRMVKQIGEIALSS